MVLNMTLVQRHRLPLILYWAVAIEGLSESLVNDISSTLESYFDIKDVPAVLHLIPLLPSTTQTASKDALKKALDDQNDEEAFDYLYKRLIDREATLKKRSVTIPCPSQLR